MLPSSQLSPPFLVPSTSLNTEEQKEAQGSERKALEFLFPLLPSSREQLIVI